jgi:Galactose oxidase, central domain
MPGQFLARLDLGRPLVAIFVVVSMAACSPSPTQAPASTHGDPVSTLSQTPTSTATRPPAMSPSGLPSSTPGAIAVPAWHATDAMGTPRAFHTATLLGDGDVLVAGGRVSDRLDGTVLSTAELYDPVSGTWTATNGMNKARWGHVATLLPDGRVLVAGGFRTGGDALASAELFDPGSGTWTATGRMTRARAGHTATLLPNGKVLVVSGGAEEKEAEGDPRSASAELYDPDTGTWTATTSMIEARKGSTATLLADGTVLVAGGDGDFTAAELYDPRTAKWTVTGSMVDGRFGHTATLLADDNVLVTGGCACSEPGALASAELYGSSARTWTTTGSMDEARIFHTATLMPSGRVLVVDDGLAGDRPTSAELYDPQTGTWTATVSPVQSHFAYTATRLLDGRVLVVGDYGDGTQASAELYDPGIGP